MNALVDPRPAVNGRTKKISAQRRCRTAECKQKDSYVATLYPKGALRDAHIRWANNDRRLTPLTKLIAVTLVSIYPNDGIYKSHGELVVWPSIRALAKDCDCSKSKANDAINELIETGHLSEWAGTVPRRELKGRPSRALALNDPPFEFLLTWKDFVHSRNGQSGEDFVHPAGGTLSTLKGDFVHSKSKLCPKNLDSPSTPIESIPTESRDSMNQIQGREDSKANAGKDGDSRRAKIEDSREAKMGQSVNKVTTPDVTTKSGKPQGANAMHARVPLMEHVLGIVNAELNKLDSLHAMARRRAMVLGKMRPPAPVNPLVDAEIPF